MQKSILNQKIITLLSNYLGVEAEDINPEDSFEEDLHMSKVDLADFAHKLEGEGIQIPPEEINNYKTVSDLVEFLIQEVV